MLEPIIGVPNFLSFSLYHGFPEHVMLSLTGPWMGHRCVMALFLLGTLMCQSGGPSVFPTISHRKPHLGGESLEARLRGFGGFAVLYE